MEQYLFQHEEWKQWYNCSLINIDSVPLERRQQHRMAGCMTIVLCAFYYSLYIPCAFSLWKQQKDGNACYRLLFYMACLDLSVLWSLGFLQGILTLQGAVYCSHPNLLYFAGVLNDSCYVTETLAELVLAINRTLDMLAPHLSTFLFEGKKLFLWLTIVTLYGLYWLWYLPPAVWSSTYFAYFFNPFQGYIEDTGQKYHPIMHPLHNWGVGIGVPLVYITFLIGLQFRVRGQGGTVGINRLQLMTFLQVLVLSILHSIGCALYTVIQIVPMGLGWIVVDQFLWLHIHGLPPVIYLALNRTVRTDVLMLFHRIFLPNRVQPS